MPDNHLQSQDHEPLQVDSANPDPFRGMPIKYTFGGNRPGPNVLFGSWSPVLDAVSQRLILLPSLPWMWGQLHLISLDQMEDDWENGIATRIPELQFDDVTVFSSPARDNITVGDIDACYRMILSKCAGFGMIQGRGVQSRPD